jgi:hypothetical protein
MSFEKLVLPELNRRNIAALGMKPICGTGDPVKQGIASAEEMLRYAMSLPVTTTITGMDNLDIARQALQVAQNFKPMSSAEMQALRDRVRANALDARYEPYKVSLKFDNPEARLAHDFPLDMQQKEVKEMLGESQNTGTPYPKYQPQQQ